MKLEKRLLEVFYQTLSDTSLSLADARIRDSRLKVLKDFLEQYYQERTTIYESFCIKNEDGKPDTSDGKYHFEPSQVQSVNEEVTTLNNEEVQFEDEPKIKEFVESTNYKPKAWETELIDELISKL